MTSTVYVQKTDRRAEFTTAVLVKFTRDLLVRRPRRVLVKPNIVSHESYPTTTHPVVLDTVLRFLRKFDCEVVAGDGPAVDAGRPELLVRAHPLASVCSDHGIELINFHSRPFNKVKTERGFTVHVSSVAAECDYIISLPVLKPHPNCTLTGALKNQFGFFPNRERLLMHSRFLKDIHRSIAEVNTVARPHLTIMDAVETYRGANEKRHGGEPAHLGYMLAGSDPVALDCHGLKLLASIEPSLAGKAPEDVPHLSWALKLGVGQKEYREVALGAG